MQHSVLLGRDSSMRSEDRTHRFFALPIRGIVRLRKQALIHDHDGPHSLIKDPEFSRRGDRFHLIHEGTCVIDPCDYPQTLGDNLVRESGAHALVGEYLVDVKPESSIISAGIYSHSSLSVIQVPGGIHSYNYIAYFSQKSEGDFLGFGADVQYDREAMGVGQTKG